MVCHCAYPCARKEIQIIKPDRWEGFSTISVVKEFSIVCVL